MELRTPLDKLRRAHPVLADQLSWLSNASEQSSSADDQSSVQLVRGENSLTESAEGQAQWYREQVFEREKLLEQIRALPALMKKSVANDGRVISREERGARLAVQGGHGFGYILAELWTKIVRPILRALGLLKTPRRLSRVFWCPTGSLSFIPIHAAGIYDRPGPGNKVSDFVISSYVPTLGVPSLSRQQNVVPGHVHLLAVSQPASDGQAHLSGARREIDYIKETADSSSHVSLRESSGIVEKVLDVMEKSDWVLLHVTVFKTLRVPQTADSALLINVLCGYRTSSNSLAPLVASPSSQRAKLRRVTQSSRKRPCTLLRVCFSRAMGASSVRSRRDSVAPELAKYVYEQLFRDGRIPDCREAAGALYDAVERLRQRYEPLIAWVPLIHIGL